MMCWIRNRQIYLCFQEKFEEVLLRTVRVMDLLHKSSQLNSGRTQKGEMPRSREVACDTARSDSHREDDKLTEPVDAQL